HTVRTGIAQTHPQRAGARASVEGKSNRPGRLIGDIRAVIIRIKNPGDDLSGFIPYRLHARHRVKLDGLSVDGHLMGSRYGRVWIERHVLRFTDTSKKQQDKNKFLHNEVFTQLTVYFAGTPSAGIVCLMKSRKSS